MINGNLKKFFFLLFLFSTSLKSEPISGYAVTLQVLDKVTSQIENIEVYIGEYVKFGSLTIKIYLCKKRPPEEVPEDFVLLKIEDDSNPINSKIVYQGWMISSSPSVTPFEHPTYDVWVKDCKINNLM